MQFRSALVAATIALAGCTAPAGPAFVEPVTPPRSSPVTFPGLLPSAANRGANRYIFQIHGIHTLDRQQWAYSLFTPILHSGYQQNAGMWKDAPLSQGQYISGQGLTCKDNPQCYFDHFGQYRRDVFTNTGTGDTVTVYSYFWRDDLWQITGPYLKNDIDANTIYGFGDRSWFNALIKVQLMDEGLSDAAGYLSSIGPLEREGVETVLCAMLAEAIGSDPGKPGKGCLQALGPKIDTLDSKQVEFNFLSHSLGSRMLYDVISVEDSDTKAQLTDERLRARIFLAGHARTQFMAANQLPLLAVSGVSVSPDNPASQPRSKGPRFSLIELRRRFQSNNWGKLSVVSFQDPDDILGFKASDATLGDTPKDVDIIDILHRNTPQILFSIAWPTDAHDNELFQQNSLEMILCGAKADSSGYLTPGTCLPSR